MASDPAALRLRHAALLPAWLPPVSTAFLEFVVTTQVPVLFQLSVLINTCSASTWGVPANLLRIFRIVPFKSLSTPEIVTTTYRGAHLGECKWQN